MTGLEIPTQLLIVGLLLHLRFVGMIFASPIFTSTMVSMPFRYLFAVLLTVAAMGTMGGAEVSLFLFDSWVSVFVLALRELLIGLGLGFLASLPLLALRVAGEQIGLSMGFSMASVVDPATMTQNSIVGQLQFLIGLWFYFRWNGHLLMVRAVLESLRLIPLGSLVLMPEQQMPLGLWFQSIFVLAMKMVIPFYCALLLADIGLGFLARTVPQMNIFILGLPIKVGLGFFLLAIVLPMSVDLIFPQLERWIEFALESSLVWRF
ncbi:MAG: flagellar biosynthetic protein FliR [Fretibacterium sp.]|nr:flagellar biosynthetic protein FliR [Fretibacterium sp.]